MQCFESKVLIQIFWSFKTNKTPQTNKPNLNRQLDEGLFTFFSRKIFQKNMFRFLRQIVRLSLLCGRGDFKITLKSAFSPNFGLIFGEFKSFEETKLLNSPKFEEHPTPRQLWSGLTEIDWSIPWFTVNDAATYCRWRSRWIAAVNCRVKCRLAVYRQRYSWVKRWKFSSQQAGDPHRVISLRLLTKETSKLFSEVSLENAWCQVGGLPKNWFIFTF